MSESINPNVPITNPTTNETGAIEVTGAENSGALWDALETISSKPKKAEKTEEKPKEKTEKSIDLSSDDKKGEKVADKKDDKKPEAKESKEKDDEKTQEEKNEAEIKKAIRKLKAKTAEGDLEIDEDALLDVKINGKLESVPLKDVLSNYSGKTDWTRKYSELNVEKQTFKKAQDMANQKLRDIFEEQDAEMKLFKLADLAGQDPVKFYQGWHENGVKLLENYYQLNDDQRKAAMLEAENKYHRTKAERLESERKQEIERSQTQQKVSALKAQAKVRDEDFDAAYEALQDIYQNPSEVKSLGLPENLTPETVIEAIKKDRIITQATTKMKELNLGWTAQEARQKLLQFTDNAILAGFEPEEIPEIFDSIFGVKAAKKKVETKEKEREEFMKGKTEVKQAKMASQEPMLFDDLF